MKKIKTIEIELNERKELIYTLFLLNNLTESEQLTASKLFTEFEKQINGVGKTEGKKLFTDDITKDVFKKLLNIGIIEKIEQKKESKYIFTEAEKIIIEIKGAVTNSPKSKNSPQDKEKQIKTK